VIESVIESVSKRESVSVSKSKSKSKSESVSVSDNESESKSEDESESKKKHMHGMETDEGDEKGDEGFGKGRHRVKNGR
jgi:hypothetical protein